MKGTAALLVVMGATLILAPAVMDYLYQRNFVYLVTRTTGVPDLVRTLGGGYRLFMIIFGTLMVFIGVGMGFASLERGPKT